MCICTEASGRWQHGRGFCGGISDPLSGGSLQMESSKAEKRGLGLSENGA
mgnify:CR=1 FL=1